MRHFGHFLFIICLFFSVQSFAAERGKALFGLCISCHGQNGQGDQTIGAPAIAGLPEYYIETQLQNFMSGGRGRHPNDDNGNRMRPMARTLAKEDVKIVATYVSSLNTFPSVATVNGNAANGRAYYAVCISCHGQKGEGNPTVKAPPLKWTNDWYLVHQLINFKTQVRAYDPTLDTMGTAMRGMAGTLPDEQAMKDVITYAQSLQ
jgi:cytochrome c553